MADLGTLYAGKPVIANTVQIPQDDAFFAPPVIVGGNNVRRVRRTATLKQVLNKYADLAIFIADGKRMNVDPIAVRRVSGTTKKNGVNTSGLRVFVFRRDTGLLIGSTVSSSGGAFSVDIVGYGGACTVVAFDNDNEPLNASVIDVVTPVV